MKTNAQNNDVSAPHHSEVLRGLLLQLKELGEPHPTEWVLSKLEISRKTWEGWLAGPDKTWGRTPESYAVKYLILLIDQLRINKSHHDSKDKRNIWTPEETDRLKALFPTMGIACASEFPNKKESAVRAKASSIRLLTKHGRGTHINRAHNTGPQRGSKMLRWTSEELEYLKKSYGKIPTPDIHKILANRSIQSIYVKARNLKLKSSIAYWTEEEDDFLRNNHMDYRVKDLAVKLNKPLPATKQRLVRLGLKKSISP